MISILSNCFLSSFLLSIISLHFFYLLSILCIYLLSPSPVSHLIRFLHFLISTFSPPFTPCFLICLLLSLSFHFSTLYPICSPVHFLHSLSSPFSPHIPPSSSSSLASSLSPYFSPCSPSLPPLISSLHSVLHFLYVPFLFPLPSPP